MQSLFLALPVIVIFWGIVAILFPRFSWQVTESWKYRNIKPTDKSLLAQRIIGGIILVFGIVLLIVLLQMD